MNNLESFYAHFAQCPLVAILRGIRPDEVEAVGEALCDSGFTLVEVPLNSPDPFESIGRLVASLGRRATIGAGTVLKASDVGQVAKVGGQMIISPNADHGVIAATKAAGLVSLPGVFTPSEAFSALSAGAHALKLFPADGAEPAVLKAWRAVMPLSVPIIPVGGITPDTMGQWQSAGAAGFGIGSALYAPGLDATIVAARAAHFIASYRSAKPVITSAA